MPVEYRKNYPKAKRITEDIELPDGWLQSRFDDYLEEKPGGREAWGHLMFGSNVVLLVLLAAKITSDTSCDLQDSRKRLREFSKGLRAGIPQILATAELIDELSSTLSDRNVHLEQFVDLPKQLRAYSEQISGFSKISAKLSTERLPKSADYALFFLHSYLTVATGQPQWRGLATLLEAAHAGHGHSVEVDEEALRQKVKRMRSRDAKLCSHYEQRARDYYSAGNGNWPTRKELKEMTQKIVLDLAERFVHETFPDANIAK
jgi:hypothetical protein